MTTSVKISILGRESIFMGHSILPQIVNETLATITASTFAVITDSNLANLHLDSLIDAFAKQIPHTSRLLSFIVPPGESIKTREMKGLVEDFLLGNNCTRDTCIIAFGGGVIGDMMGFVASTFMRGIPVIQIPTTLLAMVDSAVGGKTAVDTLHGKNLVGAFHQPARIFIDTSYLLTLPLREFSNGMAEIIKTAAISNTDDFELLENANKDIMGFANGSNNSAEASQMVVAAIRGSVSFKAHVVTADEREGGLRGLLNFGHSVGHAIEAILTPHILHGECISIGMIREAEISCHLGHLSGVAVGRLKRCLQSYNLPVSLDEAFIKKYAPNKHCSVDALLDVMRIDKKNQGSQKRIVLLSAIGSTHEQKASFVSDDCIRKILSPAMRVQGLQDFDKACRDIKVPGSKSISNRALLLAALGSGKCRLIGLLYSDDVQVMLSALQKLVGISYVWENDGETLVIEGGSGRLQCSKEEIYLGNAGTASRFLTTVCALIKRSSRDERICTILTGNPRMKERPIGSLVDALLANGAAITYLESKGSLPISIEASQIGLPGGVMELSASISSQYVSSILMSAPYAATPVTLVLVGDAVISKPYIEMTISMMKTFGIHVTKDFERENTYHIPIGVYTNPSEYIIEADASSATYPLAFAAVTGTTVKVTNIGAMSLQGDAAFAVKVLREMGCTVEQSDTSTTVTGPKHLLNIPRIDMETMTDAFLTASIVAAFAAGSTEIYGIANQRVKECNRIAAMIEQLNRFNVLCEETDDGLIIHGTADRSLVKPIVGAVKCFDDHRVAMAFSVFAMGLTFPTLVSEKRCVEKTWPGWWDVLENELGGRLEGVDIPKDSALLSMNQAKASIVLVGMRGVGKSKFGALIAKNLGRVFIDLDTILEDQLSSTIPDIIKTNGWDYFRQQEKRVLFEVLELHPINAVIATGGGVIETPDCLRKLKEISGRLCHIVHIKQGNFQDTINYLVLDKSRPAFGEDLVAVWDRRKSLYKECSSVEFIIVRSANESWDVVEADFIRFTAFLIAPSPVPVRNPSFFISLTFEDFNAIDVAHIARMVEGVNAVELRVDLLKCTSIDFVGVQVFRLRRLLALIGSSLPLIFTVRSKSQAGQFPDGRFTDMMTLLKHAVQWGCEYVDVEMLDASGNCNDERLALVKSVLAIKGNSLIIGSFHDMTGSISWVDQIIVNKNPEAPHIQGIASKFTSMKTIYELIHPHSDIIKLIGSASAMQDNYRLREFVDTIVPSLGLTSKPLIALNMGRIGQISRALNYTLSPVTHESMQIAAAPGQLTVKQIHNWRYLSGLIPERVVYLFGSPIQHSLSPALHNAGFSELGYPYTYKLCETLDATHAAAFIRTAMDNDTFGGGSVTIPLKETLLALGIFDLITQSAKAIGAVNTISLQTLPDTTRVLVGDNTDWQGISACISRYYSSRVPNRIGIVIGGGGTARAACYALGHMKCTHVYIWNRTLSKARTLASAFQSVWLYTTFIAVENIADLLDRGLGPYHVVSTIPADTQQTLNLDSLIAPLLRRTSEGVLIELAYKPRITLLMQKFAAIGSGWKTVEGLEVLIEQGYEQFDRWTGLSIPKIAMRKGVERSLDRSI